MAQGALTPQPAPNVAVIGGGCAGLTATARLAEAGIPTTVFEAAPQLGGRARGLSWKGQRLDNGQHILLGAYSETLALMRLASLDFDQALLRMPLQLCMHGEFELRAQPSLPAPLHLLAGLLKARDLTWPERFAAIRFMIRLHLVGFKLETDEPLLPLLQRKSQSARMIRLLWEPLCLAALNTPVADASAQVFLNVLRDSFARSRSDSDLLLPRRDLGTLLAEPIAAYVRSKGGDVRTGSTVHAVTRMSDSGYRLQMQDGRNIDFSHVVIATAPAAAATLLPPLPELMPIADLCRQFRYQPIYTVYLQYAPATRLPAPMIGLGTGYSQWLFDRGRLYGQDGLIAAVISAEGPHQALTQQALAAAVAAELSQAFPAFSTPLWHKVIAEKRATFACTPALPRPAGQTPLPGLYLAGDYTAGDYPATIEGAVRNGTQCANRIIAELGRNPRHN